MKKYDLIVIGTGSAMNIVDALFSHGAHIKVAVVEKDQIGGICLTRGCIPTKMLLYRAELVDYIKRASQFGIEAEIKRIDFPGIMTEVMSEIDHESEMIKRSLIQHPRIDLYHTVGEFIDDYTMRVGNETITAPRIIIGAGSRPYIPPIEGLEEVGYHTHETILRIKKLPKSMVIVGGGFIAAEFGYFFALMGTDVTIIGRNPQFLPSEEPEVSEVVKEDLSKHMKIYTGFEVKEVEKRNGAKVVMAENRLTGDTLQVEAEEILIAAGRASNSDILKPENTGVKTDEKGWIIANEYLETTMQDIWVIGDANGKHMFKHVANYESEIVFYNAFTDHKIKVDYHAVPHAVFTYPEVASVGMKEEEAEKETDILVGYYPYEQTAKGSAMKSKNHFVKVIVEADTYRILGAHIVGPYASILIQEIVNLMYTHDQSAIPLLRAMHIHPALSEVVERAFYNLHEPHHHHHHHEHEHEHVHEHEH